MTCRFDTLRTGETEVVSSAPEPTARLPSGFRPGASAQALLDSWPMTEPTARLTRADVEHVAHLARLALTPEEIDEFTGQLAGILEHAAQVAALDTADVPPTAHPLPLQNVLRADEPRAGAPRDEVLAAAPAAEDGRFSVPRILGEAP